MHFNQLIDFIGHFMGAVLQLILIMLMSRRKEKRHSEKIFFTLVVAVFIWHSGNFVTIFSNLLTGERVMIIALIWDTAATLSIGFVPALLVHTLLSFLDESSEFSLSRKRYLPLLLSYAPLVLLWSVPLRLVQHPELPRTENIISAADIFHYWAILAIAAAALICYRLSVLSRDDVQRRFYISMVRTFVIIFGLFIFTYVLSAKSLPVLGPYFRSACALAPMFPTIIFSYFILRYNYMEYVLKRSIFYSVLAVFVLAVYILGIRRIGDAVETALNIDFRIIEAILVIGLIFLVEPLRERFQSIFNTLFFREQNYYRRVFSELSHRLASLQGIEVGRLLRYVANSVQAAMRLSNCKIILLRNEEGDMVLDETSFLLKPPEFPNIIRYFQNTRSQSISLWQARDQFIVREMKDLEANLVLPIYREGNLAGIMSLGSSMQYRELYENEIEMLGILLNHLISSIDNTRLLRDKLELERRMFADEKWMSLGKLAGQIAHEVKNPLSSMKAITHVMREELPQESQFYKDLSMVEGEIDKLAGVVNQLLLVARPKAHEEQVTDLQDVVENVSSVLRPEASQANITVACSYNGSIPPLQADHLMIREILFNVMHNGIQSMTDGGTLSVAVTYPAQGVEKPSIQVVVRDTGSGISDEDMPKIFEPFYTTREGGTGLGLWVVSEKLTDLGGTIRVESENGTTVTIVIPVEPTASTQSSFTLDKPQEKEDVRLENPARG
jgi:signal transduction histidine kinase